MPADDDEDGDDDDDDDDDIILLIVHVINWVTWHPLDLNSKTIQGYEMEGVWGGMLGFKNRILHLGKI